MPNVLHFTKRSLESIPTPAKGRALYWDDECSGLGILKQKSGHSSFFWRKRVGGDVVWETLGPGNLPLEDIRKAASKLNVKAMEWKAAGFVPPNPFKAADPGMTFGEVFEHYLRHHLKKKNPSAVVDERNRFDCHLDGWRNRRLSTIERSDVQELHTLIAEKSGTVAANRVVLKIRKYFYHAIGSMKFTGANPAAKAKPLLTPEKSRRRFISPEEMPGFLTALDHEVNTDLKHFVKFGLFSGARKSDILSMRWSDIINGAWHVPNKKEPDNPYTVSLKQPLLKILDERKKLTKDSPFVFPSADAKGGHVKDLKKSWASFLKRAKISEHLTQHDLRRTHASWMAMRGASVLMIGQALGHSEKSNATAIYSRLTPGTSDQFSEFAVMDMLAAKEKQN